MTIAALLAGMLLMTRSAVPSPAPHHPAQAERLSGTAPWIPYYGYGAGVVRLSLGDNSELGGKVAGGYTRWNLFTDATLTAGGQVWVRDGKLTVP